MSETDECISRIALLLGVSAQQVATLISSLQMSLELKVVRAKLLDKFAASKTEHLNKLRRAKGDEVPREQAFLDCLDVVTNQINEPL